MSNQSQSKRHNGSGPDDHCLAELLEEALGHDRAEVEAFLLRRTRDSELAAAVIRLLDSEPGSTGFLASPIEPDRHLQDQNLTENEGGITYRPTD